MGCRTDRCHSLLRETLPVSDAPGGQRPSFGCTFTEGGRKTFSLPPWACHFVLKYSDLHPAVLCPGLGAGRLFSSRQKKAFCVPYCLFIFLCNMTADTIFLCSLQLQKDGVTLPMLAAALFFALQSAVCSVLLEWFYPLRGRKTESDLWHPPRKYIVPAAMLFLARAVGTLPLLMPVLFALLAAEIVVLLLWRRDPFGKMT